MADGWLYDGQSAVRRIVSIERAGEALRIAGEGHAETAPPALLHVESREDVEIYGRDDLSGWRLGITKPIPPEIQALLPERRVYGGWIDRIGLPKALLAGAAASVVILFIGYGAPKWLAPLVPAQWEQTFGDALVGDFGGKFCAAPQGQAALDKLVAKLTTHPRDFNVRVVDIDMVNAAALPGANIVLFESLLKEAKGPDEVAGILGHELAHVENHDVTEAMIRQMGFSMIVSAFGGNTGANVDSMLSANYSRGAETEADADAIQALRAANISPLPTARFFERLEEQEKALGSLRASLEYLSTHPLSEARRAKFEAASVRGRDYQPSLTAEEWRALTNICEEPSEPG